MNYDSIATHTHTHRHSSTHSTCCSCALQQTVATIKFIVIKILSLSALFFIQQFILDRLSEKNIYLHICDIYSDFYMNTISLIITISVYRIYLHNLNIN